MIVYTWDKKWGNYYGNSLLKAVYKNWFIKDNMLKFANIAFERFGSPILLGISRDVKSMEILKQYYQKIRLFTSKNISKIRLENKVVEKYIFP